MSDAVIRVEHLKKRYLLSHEPKERYTALRDVITRGAKDLARRLMAPSQEILSSSEEEFWALQDVSFEINQGDRVGIIGRNGAGKSTLLKILSRITEPTSGRMALKGRVASLLEVGTGFHPELTGRENIYLNGAILGMSRVEIRKKFDEIVAFAEVERFLDTPVKRYSSGMYVRLAFGVAAHLEPEILIVDEVLAVGDMGFQKKCLGRMGEVAREGRTVLFVSHNMAAIRALCSRALFMKEGQIFLDTDVETAVNRYLGEDESTEAYVVWNPQKAPQAPELRFTEAYILNDKGERSATIDCRRNFTIGVEYEILKPLSSGVRIGFGMQNNEGIQICGSNDPKGWIHALREPGHYVTHCQFPGYMLNAGTYALYFGADMPPYRGLFVTTPYCLNFSIEDVEGHGPNNDKLPGILRPKLEWNVQQAVVN
ncbi:ABC transporter ATP-binding protein [Anthocerotibacter panamensis]|uniref:ABC transporter ATP-binding protein n=1 Tax=Anthocerotibacter panamensis TaxID=2857077 RepID=UPI001C40257A|nr:ABC transporter ATP-binding protein [Anthocerotibacter panamensis]